MFYLEVDWGMQLPFWHTISLGTRLPSHLDNGHSQPLFSSTIAYLRKDLALDTLRGFFISLQVNQWSIWKRYKKKIPAGKVFWGFFLCHSSSLDTETEADYENIKVMTENQA